MTSDLLALPANSWLDTHPFVLNNRPLKALWILVINHQLSSLAAPQSGMEEA